MKIVKPNISKIAKDFWASYGMKPNPPYDIQAAVSLILPVDVVCLSSLSILKIESWLEKRGIAFSTGVGNRDLHGFILTYQDSGFIFINGSDPENERRYTIAHEVSHFILDYKIPREMAIKKLGYEIQEVLDGLREPTYEERIDGILSSVNVHLYTHLLEKSTDGSFTDLHVLNSENDADSLALELLAPSAMIIKETKGKNKKTVFEEFKKKCNAILTTKYDLPITIAEEYASRISYGITGGPSILTKLGF